MIKRTNPRSSVTPARVSERRGIQFLPVLTPQRQMLVHHLGKKMVVTPLDEVDELMDDQVLETPRGLLRKLEIQPDSAGIHAARAPLGLHLLDAPVGCANSKLGSPFGQERRNKLAQPLLDKIIDRSNKTPGELTSGAIIQASTTAIYVRTQLNEAKHIHALALVGLERATAGAFSIYPIPGSASKK